MSEFDDIRPYSDEEIPEKIVELVNDPDLIHSACQLKFGNAYRYFPFLLRPFMRAVLKSKTKHLTTLAKLHNEIAKYVAHVVRTTTDGFTHSGIELVPANEPCLFISNHRDITLDTIFMNYALWLNNLPTTQTAVGDNLFSHGFESEFMRINRSFVVVRSSKGVKAQFQAMTRTSRYIRKTMEEGESIWIAQRQGRTKDGIDRTDPAILKMFLLAHREDGTELDDWLNSVNLVPISLSYELDPCAPLKARELRERTEHGSYEKAHHEDQESMITGITKFKGRVHVEFASPIAGQFESAEELAKEIDRCILSNLKQYQTFAEARNILQGKSSSLLTQGRVKREFEAQLHAVSSSERPYVLQQYANQLQE